MECTIGKANIKIFAKMLQCMSKIGEEVAFDVGEFKLNLTTISQSQSAFVGFSLFPSFFEKYGIIQSENGVKKFKILIKTLLNVCRSISTLQSMTLSTEKDKLVVKLLSFHDMIKLYKLNILETSPLQAIYKKETYPTTITSEPTMLSECISNFSSSLSEITFLLEKGNLTVKSYFDEDTQNAKSLLVTQLSIDVKDFAAFKSNTEEKLEMTFNLKDLKAFLAFAEITKQPITIYMDKQGSPIVFSIANTNEEENDDIQADLLLATLQTSQTTDTSQTSTQQSSTHSSSKTGGSGSGPTISSYSKSPEDKKRKREEQTFVSSGKSSTEQSSVEIHHSPDSDLTRIETRYRGESSSAPAKITEQSTPPPQNKMDDESVQATPSPPERKKKKIF